MLYYMHMPKTKKKTKRQPRKKTTPSRRKKTTKKQNPKKSMIESLVKKTHKRKHFAAIAIIVTLVWILIISALFAKPVDTRPDRLEVYFTARNMPIAGHGDTFIEVADHYDIDWRLLPAIAIRESSGGKRMMNNNPFGWGSAKIPFESIDDAIWGVGKNISGNNTSTAKWYSTTSTYKKLYYYNGTVMPTYPDEVMWIMEQF